MPVEPVGAYLRDMRERRGVSLDEISRQTRVPSRYLEALEGNRLAELPAPVFVRGFVRAYCQALGEPAEQALARLDTRGGPAAAPPPPAPSARNGPSAQAARTAEARSRTRAAVLVSFALLVVLGVALVSLTMVVRPRDERRPAEAVAQPDVSGVEQASPGPVPGVEVPPASPVGATTAAPPPPATAAPPPPPKVTPAPSVSPAPAPPVSAPAPVVSVGQSTSGVETVYRLVARTTEATWLRVRTEDGRTTEETVPAGAVREWVSNRPFVLTVGNAGGVVLELNGTELPPLGASGAVISRLVVPAEPR